MHLVEIPLNKLLYHFRRLNWIEESRIEFSRKEDQRVTILAHALHDVSGHPITSLADARKILYAVPAPVRSRVWVLYRGSLHEDRKFRFQGALFSAPEHQEYNRHLIEEETDDSEDRDPVAANIASHYGPEAAREAANLQQAIVRQARLEGKLVPAKLTEGDPHA